MVEHLLRKQVAEGSSPSRGFRHFRLAGPTLWCFAFSSTPRIGKIGGKPPKAFSAFDRWCRCSVSSEELLFLMHTKPMVSSCRLFASTELASQLAILFKKRNLGKIFFPAVFDFFRMQGLSAAFHLLQRKGMTEPL